MQRLFDVSLDSVRIFIDDLPGKAVKGGFAVSGFNTAKGPLDNYLRVNTSKILAGKVEYINLTPVNTFIGELAGKSNVVAGDNGSYNSFIGYQSGYFNTSGHHNTYIGWKAGYNVGPNAHYNVFIGNASGYYNTGSGNVFIGERSGNRNTAGTQNVFIGSYAGSKNKTASNNMFLGYGAGRRDSTGYSNTFLGTASGEWNITGNNNTYIGSLAGGSNNNSTNVMIGTEAGANATGGGNVFIGYQAGYSESTSNRLYISNSSTATPLIHGEFDNKIVTINDVMKITPRAAAPPSPVNGMIYINSTDNHIYCRLNGVWKQLD
jgi:hypothetical protein